MRLLIILLLLPVLAVAGDTTQPKSITKIFKDVYGNWVDTRGIVETDLVYPSRIPPTANAWTIVSSDSTYQYEFRRVPIVKPKPIVFTEATGKTYEITLADVKVVYNPPGTVKSVPPRKPIRKPIRTVKPVVTSERLPNGYIDFFLYIYSDVESNNVRENRAFLVIPGQRNFRLPSKKVGTNTWVLINNQWIKL